MVSGATVETQTHQLGVPDETGQGGLTRGRASSDGGLRLEELSLPDAVHECAVDWPAFRLRAQLTPYLQLDYLAAWARAFAPPDSCRVVVARRGEGLVGCGPFMTTEDRFGPLSVPTLRFVGNNVGSPGDILYTDLATTAPRAPVVRAILTYASAWRVRKWDLGFLPPSSETHALAHTILGVASDGLSADLQAYVDLTLPRSFEAFLQGISGNARRNFRRRMRGLGEHGEVTLRTVREPGPVRDTVREMIWNHRRWWEGTERAGWFGDARVERFLGEAAALLAGQGRFLAFALEVDGTPIAWNVGACDEATYFEQHISFDRAYAEYAPGVLLGILIADKLVELGVTRIALGPGLNERKLGLGGVPTNYERVRGYRGWIRTLAAAHQTWQRRRSSS